MAEKLGLYQPITTLEESNQNTVNDDLEKPYNPDDPYCIFDPELPVNFVGKPYTPEMSAEPSKTDDNVLDNPDLSKAKKDANQQEKIDGVMIPVININNTTIRNDQIIEVVIGFKDFWPTVIVKIKDENNILDMSDSPGLNNKMIIVLTMADTAAYKKISLPFYITNITRNNNENTYTGQYNINNLRSNLLKQFKFKGEKSKGRAASSKLNTWELLHAIAKDLKLGFAAQKETENINDSRYRLASSERYFNYVQKNINCSGTDETEMLDAWVDIFGYIVLVNVYKSLNSDTKPNQLAIFAQFGSNNTEPNIPGQEPKLMNRTLIKSPINGGAQNNLQIAEYKIVSDIENVYKTGTFTTLNTIRPNGFNSGNNSLHTEQVRTQENSIDGKDVEKYDFQKTVFAGFEFCEQPIIFQKHCRNQYFSKLTSNMLRIELSIANFGIQRGTLVNVLIQTNNNAQKSVILNNADNALNPQSKDTDAGNTTQTEYELTTDGDGALTRQDIPLTDVAVSGVYYVHQMEFYYVKGNDEITQVLYLIKKGSHSNYFNSNTIPKLRNGAELEATETTES